MTTLVILVMAPMLTGQLNFPVDGNWYSWTPTTFPNVLYDDGGPTANYDNDGLGGLTIYPTIGVVQVTFNFFDVESEPTTPCGYDALYIYDGEDFTTLIGQYCNSNPPPTTITSTHPSGALTFIWSTDASITQGGFDITVDDFYTSLPIVLTSFTAEPLEGIQPQVEIQFEVHSQVNNDYYTILHSTDAYDYYPITEIPGAGNSNIQHNYSYIHTSPTPGVSYYKLKQTDYDGNYEEFLPVSVIFDDPENRKLVKTINLQGQHTTNPKGLVLYIYSDNTTRKVFHP